MSCQHSVLRLSPNPRPCQSFDRSRQRRLDSLPPPLPMPGFELERRVPVMLPYPFPGPFDYRVPPDLDPKPGDVVLVPLNRREEIGVVWASPADTSGPERKRKPIPPILDTPPMRPALRQFVDWVASYTLAPPGEVMAMALRVVTPVFGPSTTGWGRADPLPEARITEARQRVLAALDAKEPRGTGELALAAGVGAGVLRGM